MGANRHRPGMATDPRRHPAEPEAVGVFPRISAAVRARRCAGRGRADNRARAGIHGADPRRICPLRCVRGTAARSGTREAPRDGLAARRLRGILCAPGAAACTHGSLKTLRVRAHHGLASRKPYVAAARHSGRVWIRFSPLSQEGSGTCSAGNGCSCSVLSCSFWHPRSAVGTPLSGCWSRHGVFRALAQHS